MRPLTDAEATAIRILQPLMEEIANARSGAAYSHWLAKPDSDEAREYRSLAIAAVGFCNELFAAAANTAGAGEQTAEPDGAAGSDRRPYDGPAARSN